MCSLSCLYAGSFLVSSAICHGSVDLQVQVRTYTSSLFSGCHPIYHPHPVADIYIPAGGTPPSHATCTFRASVPQYYYHVVNLASHAAAAAGSALAHLVRILGQRPNRFPKSYRHDPPLRARGWPMIYPGYHISPFSIFFPHLRTITGLWNCLSTKARCHICPAVDHFGLKIAPLLLFLQGCSSQW